MKKKLIKSALVFMFMISFTLAFIDKKIVNSIQDEKHKKLFGTSIGSYLKPGAAVDINYSSDIVQSGETSVVDIYLTTSLQKGEIQAILSTEKNGLILPNIDISHEFTFLIDRKKKRYHIEVDTYAEEESRYYITLLVKTIEDELIQSRIFSIPIQVGFKQNNTKSPIFVEEKDTHRKIIIMKVNGE